LPTAEIGGVDASPPPHCLFGAGWQPSVVDVIVAVFATLPAPDTTPVTVYVALWPAGRFTEPTTVLSVEPAVSHVPVPGAVHVTATEPTVAGTVSETMAVPGPVPVLFTVIV
jgi:hypothetical protein